MNITIIGSGYVGLVTGACLAELGNTVFCLDVDARKIDTLNAGEVPIYEPGLKDIIERNSAAGRLIFSTDVKASVAHGDVQFIAVGTPPDEDGSADLKHVLAAARNIGKHMDRFKVIVNKSTVPVGTAQRVRQAVTEELAQRDLPRLEFAVVSNPEFLKEGSAVEDFMHPDRIVIGVEDDATGARAQGLMRAVYAPFTRNHERTFYMDVISAELTKYAANAMLATRISFMNELANLADKVGADIELVRQGIGSDPRIGYSFLYAGTGYGGSCFPKDVQALSRVASRFGHKLNVLDAVDAVNDSQKRVLADKVVDRFGDDLSGRTFALWGLAFKPNTDDMREAPSRVLIRELLTRGARVRAHDPVAIKEAQRVLARDFTNAPRLLEHITYVERAMDALSDADALLIVTEWKAFRSPDFAAIRARLKQPLIFDGRNLYEPALMREAGIDYRAIGRSSRIPPPPEPVAGARQTSWQHSGW
ncbi:MAG TPA: UDP-glucose/GDP-mannose dehydrogenase family protein [Noviherbaspirillum sp.]|uniref:UDP-glucose dehydrogenase family protein n=1 Tax=Noviherbaspirillum sp. TaxID=1926288 RepID=UPI002B49CB10|nr:UDP-glucose/GDP-mannose dehydrogenase family protein [Noviherbaspirillum sp.]HJV84461.1 UDP-glucose/GDP-mannose dehydrogenase family protein [Noviherbaspirillum sp.]